MTHAKFLKVNTLSLCYIACIVNVPFSKTKCLFSTDEEVPEVRCVSPYTVTLQNQFDYRDVAMGSLVTSSSDNSGSVTLTFEPSSLKLDRQSVGEIYTVRATAEDPSGNTNYCLVQISVEGIGLRF